jgi:hypothetical protein
MAFTTPPKQNGNKKHAANSFWFATSPSRRDVVIHKKIPTEPAGIFH